MSAEWETVNVLACPPRASSVTYRLPVPGGWLYRYTVLIGHEPQMATMCFVPDANQEDANRAANMEAISQLMK